jgi:hypothetical protein
MEPPLTFRDRAALAVSVVAVAAMYVLSFDLLRRLRWQGLAALGIVTAAALAWLVFVPLLLAVTRARAAPARWLDACLRTMGAGNGVLVLAVILNVAAVAFQFPRRAVVDALPLAHGALLLLADLVMGATFLRQARALGVSPARAVALWLVGFNGTLVMALWLSGLYRMISRLF